MPQEAQRRSENGAAQNNQFSTLGYVRKEQLVGDVLDVRLVEILQDPLGALREALRRARDRRDVVLVRLPVDLERWVFLEVALLDEPEKEI